MKAKTFSIIAVLILLFAICGCQPTPQSEIVVNKEEPIPTKSVNQQQEVPHDYEAPSEWIETDDTIADGLAVIANAKVEMPKVEKYPVVEVEPQKFTQQQIDEFIEYFVGSKKLFAWPSPESKEDLQEQLIEYKRGMLVDGTYLPPEPEDPYIKELEERIASAPEGNTRVYIDATLKPTEYGRMELCAGIEWSENEDARVMVTNHGTEDLDSSFIFHRGGTMLDEATSEINNIEMKGTELSEADAIAYAQECIDDLGIPNMALSGAERTQMIAQGSLAGLFSDYESSGYEVLFVQEYGGMQLVDTSNGGVYETVTGMSSQEYMPEYNAPWYPSTIRFYVDEGGVQRMSWIGCSSIGEVITENASLLPFDEITERAKKQLYYMNGAVVPMNENTEICVDRMTLGLALVNKKDEPGVGILMPAWYFFYDLNVTRDYGNESRVVTQQGSLVLSALDGSVITPIPMPRM